MCGSSARNASDNNDRGQDDPRSTSLSARQQNIVITRILASAGSPDTGTSKRQQKSELIAGVVFADLEFERMKGTSFGASST